MPRKYYRKRSKHPSYLFTRRHGGVKLGLGKRGKFSGIGTRVVTGGYGTKRSSVKKRGR